MIKLAYTGTTRLQNILTPYQPYGDPDMGKAIPQIRDNPPHLLIIHAPEPIYPIYGTPIEQIITELADNGTTTIIIQPDGAENIAPGLPHTIYLTPQDDLTPYLIVAGLTPETGIALTVGEPGLESISVEEPESISVGEPESVSVEELESEFESVAGVETGIKNESFSETVWADESRTEPEPESISVEELGPVEESEFEPASVEESEPEPEPEPESELESELGAENGAGSELAWAVEPEPEPVAEPDSVEGLEPEPVAEPDSVEGFEPESVPIDESVRTPEGFESSPATYPGNVSESGSITYPGNESDSSVYPRNESVWAGGSSIESAPVEEPELESNSVGEPESNPVEEPEPNPVEELEPAPVEELESDSEPVWGAEPTVGAEVLGETVPEVSDSWPVLDTVDGTGVTPVTQLELVTEPEPLSEPEQEPATEQVSMVESEQEPAMVRGDSYGSGQVLDEKPEPAAKLGTTPLNVEDGNQRVDSAEEFLSMTEPESESESEPVVEVEPASENSTPDWLTPESVPVVEPEPGNGTPDWLAPESVPDPVFESASDPVFETATDSKTSEPDSVSAPSFEAVDGNNDSSWLTLESAPVVEATADSTPNWLTQPVAESASDFMSTVEPETMPVAEPAPVVEPASENSTPGWLTPEPVSESVPAPEDGNSTPDWLTPGSAPVVESAPDNGTPDWLTHPVSEPAPVVEPVSDFVSTVEAEPVSGPVTDNTPNWLAQPVSEPIPVAEAMSDGIPDWLAQPASEPAPVVEPVSDFMSTVEPDPMPVAEPAPVVESVSDNGTPGWLTPESVSESVSAPENGNNTLDWLAPESAPAVESVSELAPVVEATANGNASDWSTPQPVAEPISESVSDNGTPDWLTQSASESVSAPAPMDTPQDWTLPTTTATAAQSTPEWVKQKTQTQTVAPTPPIATVTPVRPQKTKKPTIPTITNTHHTLATLISAKGGVGKTLLTITLADTAVHYGPGGYRVSIIDVNRGQADIGPYLNLPETAPSIYQTTQNHNPLIQHLTPNRINQYRQGLGDVGYAVTLAPPTDLSDPHLIDTSLYTETINTITENSHLTLIDTATAENYDTTSLIEDVIIPATLNHAGWIIAVTDTSRTGASNLAKRLNQYFMKGISPAKTIIIINQATHPDDPAYQQATKTLQPLGTPIITIPHSSLVYQLSTQARMATSAPNMAPPLQQILSTVTGQPGFTNNTTPTPTTITTVVGSGSQAGGKPGFLNKLFK